MYAQQQLNSHFQRRPRRRRSVLVAVALCGFFASTAGLDVLVFVSPFLVLFLSTALVLLVAWWWCFLPWGGVGRHLVGGPFSRAASHLRGVSVYRNRIINYQITNQSSTVLYLGVTSRRLQFGVVTARLGDFANS